MMAKRYKKRAVVKKGLPVFDKIILGLNIIAAILLLLSYLAPGTDPRDYWFIAILGLGYPIFFIGNLIFVIYWGLRKKLFFLISTICLLTGFSFITANFGFRSQIPFGQKAANVIRVMSYNVHGFTGIGTSEGESKLDENLQLFKSEQPDIISFIEYNLKTTDSLSITDSLKKLNYRYFLFKPYVPKALNGIGNAIFSEFPILNSGIVPIKGSLKFQTIFIDIKPKNKIVRIYCIHFEGVHFKTERNTLSHAKVGVDESSLIIDKLKASFINRSYQVSQVKKHIATCPYPYILTGDLDDTPVSFTVNQMSDGLKNAFNEKGSGLGFTYYPSFLQFQIDYILTSQQFDILNYQTIYKKISDHYPIISDLKLN